MATRVNWKGILVLGQVCCPVRLHAATIRADRLGFQALNRATLNRVQMRPYDPQTGREVKREAVVRGYEAEPGHFVLVEDRELVDLEIDSSRRLALERFIARGSLDTAYLDTPYFLVPDGRTADVAFGVMREAMRRKGVVGVCRIVLTGRERAAIVEPRGKGMLLSTLRAAHEVRGDEPYFGDIAETAPDEPMIELAERIIELSPAAFDPRRDFRDRYQEALFHFVQAKRRGEKPTPAERAAPSAVPPIPLADALARSLAAAEARSTVPANGHAHEPRRSAKRPASLS